MLTLSKYSIGTGDRFSHQGKAQLQAIIKSGLDISIVWNKSHREHTIIGTSPEDVLQEAQTAVKELDWKGDYYIDADHIGLKNVDLFIDSSNYFTLDVADFIGKKADQKDIESFLEKNQKCLGELHIPNIKDPLILDKKQLESIASTYLLAIKQAKKLYMKIESRKGEGNFITEISLDETQEPQTPLEIFFILLMIAEEQIPIQTLAPKFSGHFLKGIDYVGNIKQFQKEFEEDLAIIQYVLTKYSLPVNLKLSIHSGSDKFSIYPIMNEALKKYNAGLHLKTAGTTWLEELIGLALAGNDGLEIAKEVYEKALERYDELCGPYASVINIEKEKLPSPDIVNTWSGEKFASTLRHDLKNENYDLNFRQLLHVSYKIAAEMGDRFINALKKYEKKITENVLENLYERHIKQIFV